MGKGSITERLGLTRRNSSSKAAAAADSKGTALLAEEDTTAVAPDALLTMEHDLSGKNVLITGISGIGGAFAKLCVANNANKVYVVDRDAVALKKVVADAANDAIVPIDADIGLEDGVQKIKNTVADAPIHWVLLCAAAPKQTSDMGHMLAEIGQEDFNDMMRTTVNGKLFVVQALIDNLKAAKTDSSLASSTSAPHSVMGPSVKLSRATPNSWSSQVGEVLALLRLPTDICG